MKPITRLGKNGKYLDPVGYLFSLSVLSNEDDLWMREQYMKLVDSVLPLVFLPCYSFSQSSSASGLMAFHPDFVRADRSAATRQPVLLNRFAGKHGARPIEVQIPGMDWMDIRPQYGQWRIAPPASLRNERSIDEEELRRMTDVRFPECDAHQFNIDLVELRRNTEARKAFEQRTLVSLPEAYHEELMLRRNFEFLTEEEKWAAIVRLTNSYDAELKCAVMEKTALYEQSGLIFLDFNAWPVVNKETGDERRDIREFTISCKLPRFFTPNRELPAEIWAQWMTMIEETARRYSDAFGWVSKDSFLCDTCTLQHREHLPIRWTASRRMIRSELWYQTEQIPGYAWGMLLPKSQTDAIGETTVLEKAIPTAHISRYSNGNVWIQATDSVETYPSETARQMKSAFLPFMAHGTRNISSSRLLNQALRYPLEIGNIASGQYPSECAIWE